MVESLIALLTLTSLEVVLGIDNIIFISILASKLEVRLQKQTRFIGLALAMIMRILLLFSISWVMGLTRPLFELFHHAFSGRDLILVLGGFFLLAKSTHEIHDKLEGADHHGKPVKKSSQRAVLLQIILLDMVFSLDSVITAVGMSNQIWIMITAVVISVGFMMVFAGPVSDFVERHPTVKILALSFLLLIGFTLLVDGLGHHVPKGYIYFAMAFSVFVEMLNLRLRGKSKPVQLHQTPL